MPPGFRAVAAWGCWLLVVFVAAFASCVCFLLGGLACWLMFKKRKATKDSMLSVFFFFFVGGGGGGWGLRRADFVSGLFRVTLQTPMVTTFWNPFPA